jgi:plastocyanin
MSRFLRRCLLGSALLAAGCGSSNPAPPTSPSGATTIITINASGATPKSVEVALGARVRFVNSDGRSHNMTSDPHPEHSDCPELNQIGFLAAGQSRETGNLVQARTCGFHDHDNPSATALHGQIVIR